MRMSSSTRALTLRPTLRGLGLAWLIVFAQPLEQSRTPLEAPYFFVSFFPLSPSLAALRWPCLFFLACELIKLLSMAEGLMRRLHADDAYYCRMLELIPAKLYFHKNDEEKLQSTRFYKVRP